MISQIRATVHPTARGMGYFRRWATGLLCLVLLKVSAAQAAPPVLVIATSELPPYVSAEPQNSFLTTLLPEVAKEMGVVFEFRFMPWPRCEIAVDTLQVWATMPYVPSSEREQKFLFSEPLYSKRTMLFHYDNGGPSPARTFTSLSELHPYKLGGVRGYYYQSLFAQAGLELELASSEELSFRKLRAGRVDLVPAVETVGWSVIRNTFTAEEQSRFDVLDTPLNVGHNYLMTSNRYPNATQLLERFNTALSTLRENGVYHRVAERHGITVSE